MFNLIGRSDAPQQWINSYKYILDSWRLFKARAEIDNAISFAGIASNAEFQVNKNNRIPVQTNFLYMQKPFQIYIACSYCNASICRSEHQIMKHLTVTPPGPTRPEQQRPRPVRNKRLLFILWQMLVYFNLHPGTSRAERTSCRNSSNVSSLQLCNNCMLTGQHQGRNVPLMPKTLATLCRLLHQYGKCCWILP